MPDLPLNHPLATCPCGFTKGHPQVDTEPSHSLLGWILLSTGINTQPRAIIHRCRVCKTVIEKEAISGR